MSDFSFASNADVRAVTYWANKDFASYREWAGAPEGRALPCDPQYGEELVSTATEARRRYPADIAAFEAQRGA